jgi:hypothetical protein
MSWSFRWLVCGLVAIAFDAKPAFAQSACDRTCLRTMIDQYLSAVIKHDPSAAPLVVGFRQTENAINVRPGNGVWKTVTGLGKVQRRYLDATSGQAAYYGTVEEGSATAIVTVRVRVENRQLTEAEWFLARENDPGLNGARQPGRPPANLHNPELPREESASRARRSARQALRPRRARTCRRELFRRDHLARWVGGAHASGLRSRRERHAGTRGAIPPASCAGQSAGRSERTARVERLRVWSPELQWPDGCRSTNSAG